MEKKLLETKFAVVQRTDSGVVMTGCVLYDGSDLARVFADAYKRDVVILDVIPVVVDLSKYDSNAD